MLSSYPGSTSSGAGKIGNPQEIAQRGARAGPIRVRRDAFADHVIDIDASKANVPQDHIRGVLNCGVKLWLQNTITPPGRLTHSRFRLKSLFSVVWLTRDLSGFCSALSVRF